MKKVIILNKKEGETPLEALENFRKKNVLYKDMSMTYAGRLDPMASGLLVVLAGEECKKKEKYLILDKEYEFEILFGFATDTYDILGKIIDVKQNIIKNKSENKISKEKIILEIKNNLKYFKGKFIQKYPIYSSKTVNGKQLFEYARSGVDVEIPEREVFVKSLSLEKIREIKKEKLLQNIEKRIKKVKGDFRQKEILKIWNKNLKENKKTAESFLLASFKIKCESGTYVRSIANALGEKVGIPALAFSIKRTKIGKYVNI